MMSHPKLRAALTDTADWDDRILRLHEDQQRSPSSSATARSSRCVPLFQVPQESTARIVPTLLICWRTNPDKTVYTVAVDLDRTPSAASSLAILDKTWSEMS